MDGLTRTASLLLLTLALRPDVSAQETPPVPVTALNFVRAETDFYFGKTVRDGGFGKLTHRRQMAPIDAQDARLRVPRAGTAAGTATAPP